MLSSPTDRADQDDAMKRLITLFFASSAVTTMHMSHGLRVGRVFSRSPRRSHPLAAARPSDVQAVFSDVDGTLLNSSGSLSDRTRSAIVGCIDDGLYFVPATGKCRAGALNALACPELEVNCGVFANGLQVYGPAGTLTWETCLAPAVIQAAVKVADEFSQSLVGYAGDVLVCLATTPETDELHLRYSEPNPKVVPREELLQATDLNKLLILGPPDVLTRVRSQLAERLDGQAVLTQAMSQILEVLPVGCTKGRGVSVLAEQLGIPMENCIAFGDAENDIEMLQGVGTGISMGNALPSVTAAAACATKSNDEDGVAIYLEHLLKAREYARSKEG